MIIFMINDHSGFMAIFYFNGKIHYKLSFSIAMLVYQRVCQSFFSQILSPKGSKGSQLGELRKIPRGFGFTRICPEVSGIP